MSKAGKVDTVSLKMRLKAHPRGNLSLSISAAILRYDLAKIGATYVGNRAIENMAVKGIEIIHAHRGQHVALDMEELHNTDVFMLIGRSTQRAIASGGIAQDKLASRIGESICRKHYGRRWQLADEIIFDQIVAS